MRKTTVDGKTLNQRTADMLSLWEFNALTPLYVVQGSYNSGVSQSAGTHDGGGAVDISTYGLGSLEDKRWICRQGRLAGFAVWLRKTIPNLWNEHFHGIAIGDPEVSSGAAAQVRDYYAGKDGLASHGPDPDPRLAKIRVFPNVRLKRISALIIYRQFTKDNPKPQMAVKRIQWVLNEKLGSDLACDGVAGPKTREAYKDWEKKVGAPITDGVPGKFSLSILGEGRFTVSYLAFERWRKTDAYSSRTRKLLAENEERKNPTFPNKRKA